VSISSNSTCSSCCGFAVQQVVGRVISCGFFVQLERPTARTLSFNLLWICHRFAAQIVVQQIEQVELEPYALATAVWVTRICSKGIK
jgi:hypothetical protein